MKEAKKKQGTARLMELAGAKKGRMTAACVLSVLSSACRMVPYFAIYRIMQLIVLHYSEGAALAAQDFYTLAGASALGAICYGICGYCSSQLSHGAAYDILYELRIKMMSKMGRISPGYYAGSTQGALKKLLMEDVEQLEVFIAHSLCEIAAAVTVPVFTIIVLFITDWRLALVSLIPIVLSMLILSAALMKKDGAALQKKMADTKAVMEGTIVEYIHGMPVLKIFGRTSAAFSRFENDNTAFAEAVRETAYYNANGMGLYYAFFGAQVLFLLPASALILANTANFAADVITVLFFLVVCAGMKEPLENMMNLAIDGTKINQAVARIDDLLEQPEIQLKGDGKQINGADIEFDDVTFSYADSDEPAIKNMSIKLEAGTLNALVGPSGGGKSTAAKLLMHFYEPESGCIKIGGTDIREVRWDDLVKHIAYVFQDSFLFNDTIANNIKLGSENATAEQVRNAAKAANIAELIESLPKGYETIVGEETNFSGGEMQRIAIARAILKDAPIVVLDEATAYADAESEAKIQEAFSRLSKGKTVIMIAHRLKTIENADNILVINDGQLVSSGKHTELMESCPLYREMVNANDRRDCWTMRERGGEAV